MKTRFRFALVSAGVLILAVSASADLGIKIDPNEAYISGSFREMLDLRSIPRLKTWRALQASGYDRGGGFYDSGNFIRIEDGNRYVLMEADGPGCINRMWFTYKSPIGEEPYDLLIFLDDKSRPAIKADLDEVFSGKLHPFLSPLAGMCGNLKHPGRYSYVPIGFKRYCKVVLVPRGEKEQYQHRTNSFGKEIPHIYYQITYRKFEAGTPVKRFSWELSKRESTALDAVQKLWALRSEYPPGYVRDLEQITVNPKVKAGARELLFEIKGPGVVYGILLAADNAKGLWLEMTWDGAKRPQVSAPLGPFFGCADSETPEADVKGAWSGSVKGGYYCYLPMPYRRVARIAIRSKAEEDAHIRAAIGYKAEKVSKDDCLFHARRYDYASPEIGKNYCVADIKGAGHFIGLVMDRPGHMEGDDSFFVDGEKEPSIRGTGTEDYFNFAWGLSHTGTLALHGITIQNGSPICYRMDTPWGVPFAESLRITWEHGHSSKNGANLDNQRYSGVAFYYLAEND